MQLRRTVLPLVATAALLTALATPASAAGLKDRDHDGLPDRWEVAHHLNPRSAKDAKADTDKDGVPNRLEYKLGGNPRKADTDGDGVPDGVEVKNRTKLNRTDSNGDGISDGDSDANGDGICDRDHAALGVVTGYDSESGELTVQTTRGGIATYELTDDTRIDQRDHDGWRHRPDRDPADDQPGDDTPATDDGGGDSPDVVFGDGGDDDPMAHNSTDGDDDGSFTSDDDESGDPTDGPTAVEPENYDLLEAGAVVLQVKVKDGVVERIRLA